jgi:hypothetical protein
MCKHSGQKNPKKNIATAKKRKGKKKNRKYLDFKTYLGNI